MAFSHGLPYRSTLSDFSSSSTTYSHGVHRDMADAPGISPIKRTALVVADLEAAMSFYEGVLGLITVRHGPVEDPTVFEQLGLPPGRARFAVMKAGAAAPEIGMVSLLELADPRPRRVARKSGAAHLGEAILVFHARDIDAVNDRLPGTGAEVVCPPVAFTPPSGSPQREITFRDPDGILICVIESATTD